MIFTIHEGQDPNTALIDRKTHRLIGRFADGELSTENPKLISKMIGKYPVKEEEIATFQCKKCEFKTFNQGLLMRHYKDSHPKINQ